jgi:hypothetical protein
MAGSQTRVRNVFREIGVLASVLKRRSSRPIPSVVMRSATASSHADRTPSVRGSLSFG